MTEPSQPEEAIFLEALDIESGEDRAVFLDRACGGDPRLRAAVDALLRAHQNAGDLLDLPDQTSATVEVFPSERRGDVIGPYKLLEPIGEGGMGTVYLAQQSTPVKRLVALKLIKPGMDSRQVIARFEAERACAGASQWGEAIAGYSKGLELQPDDAQALTNLAWYLVACPDPLLHDAPRAVALARKAVQQTPQEGTYWNTLGAAHFRAADCKAAVEALEKSMSLRKGGDSFDWFFLAMAHWQFGEKEKARQWHGRAVLWMDKQQPKNEELGRFRTEAEKLMGMKEKKD